MSLLGNRDELTRICSSHVEAKVTPGLSLCYGTGSGEPDSAAQTWSFGRLDYDQSAAVNEQTQYDIASLTKPFIACLWTKRWRELGDPKICQIFPSAPDGPRLSHLLAHAGGFPAHIEFFRKLRGVAAPREELLRLACATPLAYEPGSRTIYSDVGYILLGFALEKITGKPLQVLFEDEIASPLGIRAITAYPTRDFRDAHVIAPTEFDSERGLIVGEVHDENAFYSGGVCGHAGLFSSVTGVARFARAVLRAWRGDDTVFPSDVVRTFLSTSQAPNSSWRMGWDRPAATPGISHAGDSWPRTNAVGHLGFTGCSLWLSLDHDSYAVLLSNRVHPSRENQGIRDLRRDIMDWVAKTLRIDEALD